MERREVLEARIETAQRELDRLDAIEARFGDDDYAAGSVIVFDKRMGSRTYSYAAIKVDDLWYTTGPQSKRGYAWDELCLFMSEGVRKVYWATVLEEIGER